MIRRDLPSTNTNVGTAVRKSSDELLQGLKFLWRTDAFNIALSIKENMALELILLCLRKLVVGLIASLHEILQTYVDRNTLVDISKSNITELLK